MRKENNGVGLFEEAKNRDNEDELTKLLGDYFDDSVGNGDDDISEQREEALKTYYRQPYGNEKTGRSKFITSDAMDAVNWLLPSLLNVFISQPKVVEFIPANAEAIDEADQMTDFTNYIVMEENDGFSIMYKWFWDALVTKNGFVKYYFNEAERKAIENYTGVTEAQLAMLQQTEGISILEVVQNGTTLQTIQVPAPQLGMEGGQPDMMAQEGLLAPQQQQPMQQPPMQPQTIEVPIYDVKVERITREKQYKIENIAPSNVLVHNKATCVEDAKFMAILYYKTRSELLEDGFDADTLDELPTTLNTESNAEEQTRNDVNNVDMANSATPYYEIYEVYAKVPDADGIDRLHRIILCDKNAKIILEDVEVDEIPIATITPFIKPYSFFGTSLVDMVKDIQLCNTTIWRTMLDYMYTSAYPQWEILDRALVNKDDVLHRIPGGLIRTRQLGSIAPIQLPQFPTDTVGLLDRLRDVKDARTGVTAFNSGLDPNALKANTSTAGLEMAAAGRQIQDMIARTFAETGVKALYKGIYGLVVKNADSKKLIRLRGSYVEIDPTTWELPVRVSANVGLGTGTAKAKANDLQQLLALQMQFMPYRVANEKNLYNTLSELVRTLGFKNIDTFLTDPDTIPPPPPKPTQEEVAMKQIDTDMQREQLKAQMDKYQTDMKAEVEITKLNVDTALKQQALALKYADGKDPDTRTDYFPGVRD